MMHWKLDMHGWHELIVSSNDETMLMLDQLSVIPWKILLLRFECDWYIVAERLITKKV